AGGAVRGGAVEGRDNLGGLSDRRELLDPVADVSDVKAVPLAGNDALDVHDVLGTARHALLDDEILGGAESHDAALNVTPRELHAGGILPPNEPRASKARRSWARSILISACAIPPRLL